jgi:hypothetical protein
MIEQAIERNQQGEALGMQLRKDRHAFKEEFLNNCRANFAPIWDRLRLFNEAADIKQFVDRFLAWYYHFDDDNLFDG